MALANQFGNLMLDTTGASLKVTDPDGTVQVSTEPTTLLIDDYSQGITAFHTTGGTAPTISNGSGSTAEGTTASATSYVRSTQQMWLQAQTNLRIAHIVNFEATATANNTRWWGYGQNQTTPTSAAPVLNGAVFILDAANNGVLSAAIFSGGAKTTIPWNSGVTVNRDANPHRYQIDYRQSRIDWSIDGAVVATRFFPQLAVANGMYEIWGAANASTAPAAHTFGVSSSSVGDLGGNNQTISDWQNPSVRSTVKQPNIAATTADTALVVTMSTAQPVTATSPFKGEDAPAGNFDVGSFVLGVRSDTPAVATATTSANGDYAQFSVDAAGQVWTKPGAPGVTDPGLVPYRGPAVTTPAVVKASTGRVRRVRIFNPNTSVAYLQVLNTAASPAFNTNLIEEFVVPAGSTFAENIDIPTAMSTGISIGASTTAGGTTAVSTGLHVQIWYV